MLCFFSSEDPIYAKKYSEVPDSFVTKVDINLLLVIVKSYSGVNSKWRNYNNLLNITNQTVVGIDLFVIP